MKKANGKWQTAKGLWYNKLSISLQTLAFYYEL